MSFWNYEEITQVHIELTNGCNAGCPMCVRFHNNSLLVRPDLTISQITLEQFKVWFPEEFIQQLNLVLFCGVHGDPCVARDMYEICEYIGESSPKTKILVNTNGGMRTPDWWEKLGVLFANNRQKEWQLTFSIDGLADTNHLYRRNVVWSRLEKNVRAFTKSGPLTDWDYLMFKHNEHQVEEARLLSKEWGVTNFVPKKALGVDNGTNLVAMPALNKEGKLDYWIEAPEDPQKRNLETPEGEQKFSYHEFDPEQYRVLKQSKQTNVNFDSMVDTIYDRFTEENTSQWNNTKIDCKSKIWFDGGKEIFIDSRGYVLPCCYIGTHLNGKHTDVKTLQLHKHMNDYGWDRFDLNKHPLKDILNGNHLNSVYADSWEIPEVSCGRMAYCADTCGKISSIDKIFTHEGIENKSKYNKGKEVCLDGSKN